MFDITVTMRFRPPEEGPEIAKDLDGKILIDNPTIQPYSGFIVVSDYYQNPDGTVDITGLYNPAEFAERMTAMGYQVAAKGLGRCIPGWEGVVDFSPKLLDFKRAMRRACL